MRLYKWFHGARCFILKHHMFAIDIIRIYNKMIPNVSTARGAVTVIRFQNYWQKHTLTHLKHFNVSIMTQVRYKALLIREIIG